MSGVAAGGAMVLWRAKEQQGVCRRLRHALARRRSIRPTIRSSPGAMPDLFPWPRVKDDRNVQGATAVAVPGVVAGMGLAHETFGRLPWREVVAPAAEPRATRACCSTGTRAC